MDTVSAGFEDRDRFDRQRRIQWMDMERIASSDVLVAGAGALGNEAVKDLVLSGFRRIAVVDMDDIVTSNLNRCVFFRDTDVKKGMKAEIVAERASSLAPDVEITPIVGRIQDTDVSGYDIILGCLDNIAARMDLNAAACYHGIPYVDGATDGMRGKVQVVLPGTA
ncbi:MAG: ThiF family adenylyltransferase [Candidatus Methanomethylophilaceae archaeon]